MTFIHDLTCERCGKTETIRTALIYHYVLPDDERLPGLATPAWCFECGGIRSVEVLPELEQLEALLVDLETNGLDEQELLDKAAFLQVELDPKREYAMELAHRRAAFNWRASRVSPPRCLVCGGTNHTSLQLDDGCCLHPGCGGVFRTSRTAHAAQGSDLEVDAEGARLSEQNR